jgi:antirestriction protein ArdC
MVAGRNAGGKYMNVYKLVTEQILEKLSLGQVPWKKTWVNGIPCSLGTGKEYRGINIVLLGLQDHTSCYWVTYKEAIRLKGFVKKGERSAPVVFWKWRTEDEIKKLKDSGKTLHPAPCIPFFFRVFNLEQTEGLTAPQNDISLERKDKLEAAEYLLETFKDRPSISHGQHLNPCYIESADAIHMPHLSQFKSAAHYYSTLFHELIHATGHESRLARVMTGKRGSPEYSFEELVAEIGSAFLCAYTGVADEKTIEDQGAYIAHWQQFLRSDSTAFMRACSEAQKAVDYIRGTVQASKSENLNEEAGAAA